MLAVARQSALVDQVQKHGIARISDLAQMFGVSDMTIRRDIDALADAGVLERVHGGAMVPGSLSSDEPGFEKKSARQEAEKDAIARNAAELVTAGLAIGLSAGTTTWALAKLLREVPALTVVTNSIQIANVFYQRSPKKGSSGASVILTGGIRTPSDALVGPLTLSALRQIHLDLLFLGVHGVDERAGLTTPNMMEAETNKMFVATAHNVAVLADHTKWGTVGMSTIVDLDEVGIFVSDDRLPREAREVIASRVDELRIAPV